MNETPHVSLACVFVLGVLAGCSSQDDKPRATAFGGSAGTISEGGSGQGGAGGRGGNASGGSAQAGTSGAGSDAGGSHSGGRGSGGVHTGTGGETSGGSAGDGELTPTDSACAEQRAFVAGGMAFVAPTPPELGLALSRLLYDPASKPISVVARFKPSEASGSAWISASELEGFEQAFPPGFVPEPVNLALQFGGFNTTEPAKAGWLVVGADATRVRLENIELVARTSNACSVLDATLSAVIPDSEGAVELDLPSGKTTIAALAGGTTTSWNVRAVFQAATTDFDFEALP
ncbi:MAG: hypothetical protein KC766_16285 [Myxococcales bacterium]|nr:hypothetical protein [Myxococcales bacterium]